MFAGSRFAVLRRVDAVFFGALDAALLERLAELDVFDLVAGFFPAMPPPRVVLDALG